MRRYVLLGLGLAIAAAVLVLYLKDHASLPWEAAKIADINQTRMLVGYLSRTHKKESPPVAADGRIDVYAGLLVTTQAQVDEIYRSERLDLGPTLAEVRAGDYTNFPYQRFKGVPSRGDPWLWDKRPVRGQRFIVFGTSRLQRVDEQDARAILARAGQE